VGLCSFPLLMSASLPEGEVDVWPRHRIAIVACAVKVLSSHDMVVAGAGEAPVPRLLREGRSRGRWPTACWAYDDGV
jgi:hypothetical protein